MKIVINTDFGGFGVSDEAKELYKQLSGYDLSEYDVSRNDPILVKVVETLSEKANGHYGALAVVEVPDGIKWHIEEYDGMEHVAEDHRTWHAKRL